MKIERTKVFTITLDSRDIYNLLSVLLMELLTHQEIKDLLIEYDDSDLPEIFDINSVDGVGSSEIIIECEERPEE